MDDTPRLSPVRLMVVKSEGTVKRAPKVRQKPLVGMEARLKPWQARVGPPRSTKKRRNQGIRTVLTP